MTRVVAAACIILAMVVTPAAAQHEHHGAPAKLDTLTVRAQRDAVQLRSGATVINVRETTAAAGGSIADLLRTVPGIELDAQGHISMRGSTGVLLLQNGRPVPLTGEALVEFLRQMPATSLERIEVGSTTSARQNAEGTGGVINLVFRDDAAQRNGAFSLAGSVATDDHYMGSVAASGHAGERVNWDALYSLSGMRPRTDSRIARWSVVPGDFDLHTNQDSRAREQHRLHAVMAGAAITPTTNTSLALRGTYAWMEGTYRNRNAFLYTNALGDSGASTTSSVMEHEIPSGELSAVASVQGERVRFTSEARTGFVAEDSRGDHVDEVGSFTYMTKVMTSRQRAHGVRNDLEFRLPGIEVEVGHEAQLRTFTTAHDATHFYVTIAQGYRYETAVHAGYLSAQRSFGDMRAEAGLRVESERRHLELADTTTQTAVRLFPSISGRWTDTKRGLVYRLAYGRRINRPEPAMLNPFAMGDDNNLDEVIGNPALQPEIADQVELGIERQRPGMALQVTPFLRWTRDAIRPLKSATASGSTITSLQNVKRMRALGADASVRARATERAVVTLAGSVAQLKLEADAFRSSGIHATARLTVDVQVTDNTTARLYAYRRTAQTVEQGEILPMFTGELALTQRLARDRARVTLRLSDPLRSDRLEFRLADASFTEQTRRRTARPLLSLFASYAMGGAPREAAPDRAERPATIF